MISHWKIIYLGDRKKILILIVKTRGQATYFWVISAYLMMTRDKEDAKISKIPSIPQEIHAIMQIFLLFISTYRSLNWKIANFQQYFLSDSFNTLSLSRYASKIHKVTILTIEMSMNRGLFVGICQIEWEKPETGRMEYVSKMQDNTDHQVSILGVRNSTEQYWTLWLRFVNKAWQHGSRMRIIIS